MYGFWWLESDSSEFIDDDFEKCFRNVADKLLFVVDSLFHVCEEFVVEDFEIDLASDAVEFLLVVDFLRADEPSESDDASVSFFFSIFPLLLNGSLLLCIL